MFKIGSYQLNPGDKIEGMLSVINHDLKLPFCALCGEEEGATILISAGIHGAEYIGIQTAMELSREIDPSRLKGNILFLLVANPQACFSVTRMVIPEDGKNLNRMFPGEANGTLAEKTAYTIEHELQKKADFYIDLHAGDLHERVMPFVFFPGNAVAEEEVSQKSRQMAEATGMAVRVRSSATTGSYNYAAIQGIPSILIERGGRGGYSHEELECYKEEVRNVLIHLGALTGAKIPEKRSQHEVIRANYIDSEAEGFWYHQKQAGDFVKKGELLGMVKDVWGNQLQVIYAEYDGIVLYETVLMGVMAGDFLIAYGA